MPHRVIFAAALALGSFHLHADPATAEERGINVTGVSAIEVAPTMARINLQVTSAGELAIDAILKNQDAVRRTTKSIEDLKLKNLTIQPRGVRLAAEGNSAQAQMVLLNGGQPKPEKQKFKCSRQLSVTLSGIEKVDEEQLTRTLAQILDAAKDVGAVATRSSTARQSLLEIPIDIDNSDEPLVVFLVENPSATRAKAYQAAIADATSRASELARAANLQLGQIAGVTDTTQSAFSQPDANAGMAFQFEAITIRVILDVHFTVKQLPSSNQP